MLDSKVIEKYYNNGTATMVNGELYWSKALEEERAKKVARLTAPINITSTTAAMVRKANIDKSDRFAEANGGTVPQKKPQNLFQWMEEQGY